MAGMRRWFPRDCWLTSDPKIERLAGEFGAAGVLAFEEILAIAMIEQEGGRATADFDQLRKRALIKPAKLVRPIVVMIADLELIKVEQMGEKAFTYQVSKWSRWNDPTATERKQRQRERKRAAA